MWKIMLSAAALSLAAGVATAESDRSDDLNQPKERMVNGQLVREAERIPPAGRCLVVLPGVAASKQPKAMGCNQAERYAKKHGGRIVYGPKR